MTKYIPEKIKDSTLLRGLIREKMLILLIVMFIYMAFTSPFFMSSYNLINIVYQMSIYGVIACGMTVAIICGAFDLSVGSIAALSGLLVVILDTRIGLIPAIIVTLIIAVIIGLINGFLVSYAKINAFIVTLGAMTAYYGLALKICNGDPIQSSNLALTEIGNGTLFSIPYPIYVFILFVIFIQFVLTKTGFGRNIYATGGNYDVSELTGINVKFYELIIFVITAFTASVGGILLSARLGTGAPNQAQDAAMTVISAVVIGGTSLAGGKGNVLRTLVGLSILGILTNALNLMNVYPYFQMALKGMILIAVVATDSYFKKEKAIAR